jgi:hypothetical protein
MEYMLQANNEIDLTQCLIVLRKSVPPRIKMAFRHSMTIGLYPKVFRQAVKRSEKKHNFTRQQKYLAFITKQCIIGSSRDGLNRDETTGIIPFLQF